MGPNWNWPYALAGRMRDGTVRGSRFHGLQRGASAVTGGQDENSFGDYVGNVSNGHRFRRTSTSQTKPFDRVQRRNSVAIAEGVAGRRSGFGQWLRPSRPTH